MHLILLTRTWSLKCVSAYSYPKANLSRATHYETKEMHRYVSGHSSHICNDTHYIFSLALYSVCSCICLPNIGTMSDNHYGSSCDCVFWFKWGLYEALTSVIQRNKPGGIVVIYDECENIAPSVATTLVQRGYDNLFMLSGGTYGCCCTSTTSSDTHSFNTCKMFDVIWTFKRVSCNVLTENRKARVVHRHITVHNLARFNFGIYICNAEEFKAYYFNQCFLVCFAQV